MGKFSRNKGARGERELIQELSTLLGIEAGRNLNQTAVGGADCVEFPGISIEIKRCETLEIAAWWRQCVRNAGDAVPVLCYRQNRQPWTVMVPVTTLPAICAPVYTPRDKSLPQAYKITLGGFAWHYQKHLAPQCARQRSQ